MKLYKEQKINSASTLCAGLTLQLKSSVFCTVFSLPTCKTFRECHYELIWGDLVQMLEVIEVIELQ